MCLDVPLPPITQCSRGHHICQNCKAKLKACPLCKENFTASRIYIVESIIEYIPLPCKFGVEGCSFICLHTKKEEHEKNCDFRPFRCCVEGCEAAVFSHQMKNHFSSIHGEGNVLSGALDTLEDKCKFEFSLTKEMKTKLLEIPEWGLFTFKAKYLNDSVYFIVQAVIHQTKAQEFTFDFDLNLDESRRISLSSPINSLHLSEHNICLTLSNVHCDKYINDSSKFNFYIRKLSGSKN